MEELTVKHICIESDVQDVLVSDFCLSFALDAIVTNDAPVTSGKCGIAVNLIDSDATMQICKDIEEHFGRKISRIDTDNPEEIENIQN